jgi:4'-phosphopantetheinyl transferase
MYFRHSARVYEQQGHLPQHTCCGVPNGRQPRYKVGTFGRMNGGARSRLLKARMKSEGIVTVWIWPLVVSAARLAVFRETLSPDELARVGKMRLETAALEFIVGRGMTRELLAAECGCAASEITFGTGKHGKPHVEPASRDFAFNLSHSGGYCALALGRFSRIGVDIEAVRPTVGDIAKSVFTPREAHQYETVPLADRMPVFFRGWVAKEAYLKATGDGLAGGLKSLELDLAALPEIRPLTIGGDADEPHRWQFQPFDVTDTIVGAVAIDTGGSAAAKVNLRQIQC